jgi:chitinase
MLPVILYYTLWSHGAGIDAIPWSQVTQVNVAFAGIDTNDACNWVVDDASSARYGQADTTTDYEQVIAKLEAARDANNPNVKLVLSVGGATMSWRFSRVASAAPWNFAWSCVALVQRLGLDGIDYDWEYPGAFNGGTCPLPSCQSGADAANFATLLAHTRVYLGKDAVLSAAVPTLLPNSGPSVAYPVAAMDASLTFWNIMAYEYGGCWSQGTALNAPIAWSLSSLERFRDLGATPSKLVLGVPYYSKRWTSVSRDTGVGSAGTCSHQVPTYADVWQRCSTDASCSVRAAAGGDGKYCWCSDTGEWFSLDDPEVMRRKAAAVAQRGYGGVMVWAVPGDASNALTGALRQGLAPVPRASVATRVVLITD